MIIVLFDVLNIHFPADFCWRLQKKNCGMLEESIEICLMDQMASKTRCIELKISGLRMF